MHQRKTKKILTYFFLLLLVGSINNIELNNIDISEIKNIKVSGLDEVDNEIIFNDIKNLSLENIIFLDPIRLANIINSNASIEEYEIFKKYPMSLEIEIVETKFLAQTNINGKFFFIGSNGKLIANENNTKSLPYIFGDLDINSFLNLKKIIDESSLNFQEIKNLYFFPSGRWDLETLSDVLIRLPRERLKESLTLSLDLLNNEKFDNIKLIDVRQKNQVIVND